MDSAIPGCWLEHMQQAETMFQNATWVGVLQFALLRGSALLYSVQLTQQCLPLLFPPLIFEFMVKAYLHVYCLEVLLSIWLIWSCHRVRSASAMMVSGSSIQTYSAGVVRVWEIIKSQDRPVCVCSRDCWRTMDLPSSSISLNLQSTYVVFES